MYRSAPQWSIPALSTTLLLVAGIAFSAQHSASNPAFDPAHGDGGASRFYVWDEEAPRPPGQLLRQEPLPEKLGSQTPQRQCASCTALRTAWAERLASQSRVRSIFRKVLRLLQDGQ